MKQPLCTGSAPVKSRRTYLVSDTRYSHPVQNMTAFMMSNVVVTNWVHTIKKPKQIAAPALYDMMILRTLKAWIIDRGLFAQESTSLHNNIGSNNNVEDIDLAISIKISIFRTERLGIHANNIIY